MVTCQRRRWCPANMRFDITCKLRHPSLLLLMAVCQTNNLEGLVLLYERIGCGSLYHYLHQRMECLLLLDMCDLMRQICDAVIYLHSQNFLHCYISSHAIQLVTPNLAKLGNLEYMVENVKSNNLSPRTLVHTNTYVNGAFNWMAPELMDGNQPPTEASDVYSICAVIWEILNGMPPWYEVAAYDIKKDVEENGGGLQINNIEDSFKTVLHAGLNIKPSARHMSVRQLRDFLIKILVDNDAPHLQALSPRFSRRNPLRRKSRSKPIFTSSPANVAENISKTRNSDSRDTGTINNEQIHIEKKQSDSKRIDKSDGINSSTSTKKDRVSPNEEVTRSTTGLLNIAKSAFFMGLNKLGLSTSPSQESSRESSVKTEASLQSAGQSIGSATSRSVHQCLEIDETDACHVCSKQEHCECHSPSAVYSQEGEIQDTDSQTLLSTQEKDVSHPANSSSPQESEVLNTLSKKSSSQESSQCHSSSSPQESEVLNTISRKSSSQESSQCHSSSSPQESEVLNTLSRKSSSQESSQCHSSSSPEESEVLNTLSRKSSSQESSQCHSSSSPQESEVLNTLSRKSSSQESSQCHSSSSPQESEVLNTLSRKSSQERSQCHSSISPQESEVLNSLSRKSSSQESSHCHSSSSPQESEVLNALSKKSSLQESSQCDSFSGGSSPTGEVMGIVSKESTSAQTKDKSHASSTVCVSYQVSSSQEQKDGHSSHYSSSQERTVYDAVSKGQSSDCQESNDRGSQGKSDNDPSNCKFVEVIEFKTKPSQISRIYPLAEPDGEETKALAAQTLLNNYTESTLVEVDDNSNCQMLNASVLQGTACPDSNAFTREGNEGPGNPFRTDCLLTQQEDKEIKEMATTGLTTKYSSNSMDQFSIRKAPGDVKSSTVYGTLSQPASYKIPNALLKSQMVCATSNDSNKESVKATVSAQLTTAGRNYAVAPTERLAYPRSSTPLEHVGSHVGRQTGIQICCPAPFQSPSYKTVLFHSIGKETPSTGSDRFQLGSRLSTPPSTIHRNPPGGLEFHYKLSPDDHEKPTSFKPASHRQQFEGSSGNSAAGTVSAMAAMEDQVLRSGCNAFPRSNAQHENDYHPKSSTSSEMFPEEESNRSHKLENCRSNKTGHYVYKKISPRENKAEWYGGDNNIKNIIKSFQDQVKQHEKKQAVLCLKSKMRLVASCTESPDNKTGHISQEILDKARSMQQMHTHQQVLTFGHRLRRTSPKKDIEDNSPPKQISSASIFMQQMRAENLQERKKQLKSINDDECTRKSNNNEVVIPPRYHDIKDLHADPQIGASLTAPLPVIAIPFSNGVEQEQVEQSQVKKIFASKENLAEGMLKFTDSRGSGASDYNNTTSLAVPQPQIRSEGVRHVQNQSSSQEVSNTCNVYRVSSSVCLHGKTSSNSLQNTSSNRVLNSCSESKISSNMPYITESSSVIKSKTGPVRCAGSLDSFEREHKMQEKGPPTKVASSMDKPKAYSTTGINYIHGTHSTSTENCLNDCKKSISDTSMGSNNIRNHASSLYKIDVDTCEWPAQYSRISCTSKTSAENATGLASRVSHDDLVESKAKSTSSAVNSAVSCTSFGDGDSVRSCSRCSCSTDTSSVVEDPCICHIINKTPQVEPVFPSGDQNVLQMHENNSDSTSNSRSGNSSELSGASAKSCGRKLEIEDFYFDDVLHPDLTKERHMRLQTTLPLDQITHPHIISGERYNRLHQTMDCQSAQTGPDVSSIRELDQSEGDSCIWKSIQCHHTAELRAPVIMPDQEQCAATMTIVPPSVCGLLSSTMNEEFQTPTATQDNCNDGSHDQKEKSSYEEIPYYMDERCVDTHENDPAGWIAHAITAQIFEDEDMVLV